MTSNGNSNNKKKVLYVCNLPSKVFKTTNRKWLTAPLRFQRLLHVYVCTHVCVCVHACACMRAWGWGIVSKKSHNKMRFCEITYTESITSTIHLPLRHTSLDSSRGQSTNFLSKIILYEKFSGSGIHKLQRATIFFLKIN